MSTSAKQSWVQRCSRWTFPQQSYFRLCICSSRWHANVSACCFPLSWAQRGTWCTSAVTLSVSAAFTQFHPSAHLIWSLRAHFDLSPLFSSVFFNSHLPFAPSPLLINLVSVISSHYFSVFCCYLTSSVHDNYFTVYMGPTRIVVFYLVLQDVGQVSFHFFLHFHHWFYSRVHAVCQKQYWRTNNGLHLNEW